MRLLRDTARNSSHQEQVDAAVQVSKQGQRLVSDSLQLNFTQLFFGLPPSSGTAGSSRCPRGELIVAQKPPYRAV